MTFRIIDNTIEYEYRPVAVFLPHLGATLRDRAAGEIEAAKPNVISEDDHAAALRTQEKEFDDEVLRLEQERDDAKALADKWLGELNSLDDAGGAPARVVELVERNDALFESVRHWKQSFERSQETIRQLQYEAKHRKSSKNRSLDRRRSPVAD